MKSTILNKLLLATLCLLSGYSLAGTPSILNMEAPPTASFTVNAATGPAPFIVSFNGSSSNDPDGPIASYAWDFGDGTTGNGQFTNHTYTLAGTYTVSLVVTDEDDEESTPFTLDITVTEPQDPPVLNTIGDLTAIPGGATTITITATDPQAGDVLVFSAFDLPTFASLTDNGDRTATLTLDPDFADQGLYPDLNVVVSDGNLTDDEFLSVTVPEICDSISTLGCDEIAVNLPFNLSFDGNEGGLPDGDGDQTGFTLVDPPSNNLFPPSPTYPAVPGYEPDLIDVTSDQLIISSTKGIAYQLPPESANNNSQVNALGAGFVPPNSIFDVTVDLSQPAFSQSEGNNFQQAGLWYGLNEDNYVKLVVIKISDNNQRIQLALEQINPQDNSVVDVVDISTGNLPTTATTINLRLEVDPISNSIRGYYANDGGTETLIEDGMADALDLPVSFASGADHDADGQTPNLVYGGVFTTHRNAAETESIDYSFDNFGIEIAPFTPTLFFSTNPLEISLEEGATPMDTTITLFTNDGTSPAVTLSDDPASVDWLILPQNPATGDLVFRAKAGLSAGTYSTTIFAISNGYITAEMPVVLTVFLPQDAPRVLGVFPADGATDASLNTSVSANDLYLPNGENGIFGVDNSTITNQSVKLFKVTTGTEIPATVNGTGGGDGINLTPSIPLEINTEYRFVVNGVKDLTGISFELFESTFTTAADNTGSGSGLENVSFNRVGDVATGDNYTSITLGPDGKLYGLSLGGQVDRWTINVDGTLDNKESFTTLIDAYGPRIAIGFTFDPDATAGNLVAYVSHAQGVLNNGPTWDGKISRLSGANLETEDLVVTNLPRSRRDHLTNSIAFRAGAPDVMYFNQGSNSAGGAPDNSWGQRQERLLSAATLRLDLSLLPEANWPLDAKTTMNQSAINSVDVNSPTLGTGTGTYVESGGSFPDDGTYNPFFVNAPLTIYATGIRNAYDLVWHSNGQLYIPNNGTAGGSNTPESVNGTRRIDGTFYNHDDPSNNYPIIPPTTNNNTQRDFLFRVDPLNPQGYYGHPNPLRGEFVLNRGPVDVTGYDNNVSTDINYRGIAFDFEFNKSPNGVIEYTSNAEGSALQGALLVCRYSGSSDIIALIPNGPGGDILTSRVGIPGFTGFGDPLDIAENPATGDLYVSDFGRQSIVLLSPNQSSIPEPLIQLTPGEIVIEDIIDGNPSVAQTVFITNSGNGALDTPSASISGNGGGEYVLDASNLPSSLNPGQTISITVALNASSEGPKLADLVVTGDNAVVAVTTELHGLGKDGLGGNSEPSLQYIFDTYGLPINVGDQDVTTNVIDLPGGSDYNDVFGDEVDFQRFQAATDAPVEVEILAVYGPEGADPVTGFGWYTVADPATTNELFTLPNSAGNGQTLTPNFSGTLSFEAGSQEIGFYSRWPFFGDRRVNLEDALNAFPNAIPNHVRVYEVPGVDNTYILAFEEDTGGFDYQDLVVLVRNIEPVIFSSEPVLAVAPEELLFHAVIDDVNRREETKTVTITNSGASPLAIIDVQLTGVDADHYAFVGPTSLTLAPASAQTYSITFQPPVTLTDPGYKEAALTFTSNATNGPTLDFGLHGIKQFSLATADEPPLQDVVDALGVSVDVGWTTLYTTTDAALQGEEVAVSLFEAAGSEAVVLTPVARFSPDHTLPFGWYTNVPGTLELQPLDSLTGGSEEVQTLYPPAFNNNNSFDPAGQFFGIYTDNGSLLYSEDQLNTGVAHRVRTYPARDRDGALIANSYLLCFEGPADGDYQDYLFLLENVTIYVPPPPALSFAPDAMEVFAPLGGMSVDFTAVLTANVTYDANPNPITLTATEDWVMLPADFTVGTPLTLAVDATELTIGTHQATIRASALGTITGVLDLTVLVEELPEGTIRINFQDDSFNPPTSYAADTGAAYGIRADGLSYGWIDPATGNSLDNSAFAAGDERGITNESSNTDKLLRSHNNLDAVGQNQARDWELALAPGSYSVEVAVGDPSAFNSHHYIRAEGKLLIENFTPTSQATLSIGRDTVVVTDGRLTIDDVGAPEGGNTKIIYLEAFPIDSSGFAPDVTIDLLGNQQPGGGYLNQVEVTLMANDRSGSGTIDVLEYSLDGGANYQPYSAPFPVMIDGGMTSESYTLLVRAQDGFGNERNSERSFLLLAPTGALVRIENMTKVPGTNRSFPGDDFFSFNNVGIPVTLTTFTENTMRIHNEGTQTLIINRLTTSDTVSFEIMDVDIPSFGLAIEPGAFVDAKLVFNEVGGERRIITEQLVLESNADNNLAIDVTLKGGYAERQQGSNELTNQQLFEVFGFSTEMGRLPDGSYHVYPPSVYPTEEEVNDGVHGDLSLSDFFVRADPSQPVRMFQLAAQHGPNGASSWLGRASGGGLPVFFFHQSPFYQSIFPYDSGGNIAGGSSNTNDPFYISMAGYRSTGGNSRGRNQERDLGLRAMRAVDRDGNVIPNEYIIIQDYIGNGCTFCDWNDNVGYLINARPVDLPTASTINDLTVEVLSTQTYDVSGSFDQGYPGNRFAFNATLAGGGPLPAWITFDPEMGIFDLIDVPFAESNTSRDITVTATDYNQIQVSATFAVIVNETTITCTVDANADGLPKEVDCTNPSVALSGNVTEGNPVWTGPGGFTSSDLNPVVTQAGIYTLSSDDPDCGLTGTVEVTMGPDFPGSSIDGPRTILTCTIGFIELTASSVDPNATFSWLDEADQELGTGATLIVTQPGTYRLEATNASGCSSLATTVIDEDLTPASAGFDGVLTVCGNDDPVSLFEELATLGGNPVDEGSWFFDGNVISDELDPTTADEGVYLYVVGGERGCVFDSSFLTLTIADPSIYYADEDLDGLGDPNSFIYACAPPPNYVANDDDNCPFVNSQDVTDTDGDGLGNVCDQDDDDDGILDNEDCDPLDPAARLPVFYYADFDQDGFGDPANGFATCAEPPADYITDNTDNCPEVANPNQIDSDGDGLGDACDPSAAGNTEFWLEAECAVVGANWSTEEDVVASADNYVTYIGAESLNNPPQDVPANQVRFEVEGVQPGDYYVFARAFASSGSNSFWVRVNDGDWINWSLVVQNAWEWSGLQGNPFSLEDGVNTIDFAFRENDTRLDKLFLSLNPFAPGGEGLVATNCGTSMNIPPVAVASALPSNGVAPLTLQLNGRDSYDPDGIIVDFLWNWGLGSSNEVEPTITLGEGSYNVTLTVTDDRNDRNTQVINVIALGEMGDDDGDGIMNADDNCPLVPNPDQNVFTFYEDADDDGLGDPNSFVQGCEPPPGYVTNSNDNCPLLSSADFADFDGDGQGNVCDDDDDDDGILDVEDCDPFDPNVSVERLYYADFDGDGYGDPNESISACVSPNNYVADGTDNCIDISNPGQLDDDGDGIGNACDNSIAGLTAFTLEAECAVVGSGWSTITAAAASNGEAVVFASGNSYGDPPADVPANKITFIVEDVQPGVYHIFARIQATSGGNDSFWIRVNNGSWIRWWTGISVNNDYNWNEAFNSPFNLVDGQNVIDFAYREDGTVLDKLHLNISNSIPMGEGEAADNCETVTNTPPVATATATPTEGSTPLSVALNGAASADSDGIIVSYLWNWNGGSAGGAAPEITLTDIADYDITLTITDDDGATDSDVVTVSVVADTTDTDEDGILDVEDNCPTVFNPDQSLTTYYADADGDGFGDPNDFIEACERPMGYVENDDDNCPNVGSFNLFDLDEDGQGNVCDDDDDGDGAPDLDDCAPLDPNIGVGDLYYADFDEDGFGDPDNTTRACSPPSFFVLNNTDNCPDIANPGQEDSDNDGVGDPCDQTISGVNAFTLEAECAEVGMDWLTEVDPLASNGVYLTYAGANAADPPAGDTPADRIRFVVDNVPAGDYYIFTRVYAAGTSDDSYWARVNGADWTLNGNNFASFGEYIWNTLIPTPITLTEGTNVVDLSYRENGIRIDKIYITLEASAPVGEGEVGQNCDAGELNTPPVATAAASPEEGDAPLAVQLDGSASTDSDGTIISYHWTWNGGSAEGVSPQIDLTEVGVYDIMLTVTDDRGGEATDVVTVTANEPPNQMPEAVAVATPNQGFAPLSVNLDGTASSDADGTIVDYAWTWENGGSASGATVTETFALGSYNLTLTVTDDEGATGSTTISVVAFNNQTDTDGDGIADVDDNCPAVFNPDQNLFTFYADTDGDGFGDPNDTTEACEVPPGYVNNADDNCPAINSMDLTDTDNDGEGDLCDDDDDGDGVSDSEDCAPLNAAITNGDFYYADFDNDGFGDPTDSLQACSAPANYVADNTDNCPDLANPNQMDTDGDGFGDVCDNTIPGVNTFTLEAECAEVGANWLVETDPAAANGIYLTYDGPNAGTPPVGDVPASRIRFELDNVAAGDYYVYVRVYGASANDDSYWAKVNGADWTLNGNNFANFGSYVWNSLTSNPVSLTEGENTIDLSYRENGMRIDRIYISAEAGAPVGEGDAALNCDAGQLNDPPVALAAASPEDGIVPLNVQLDGTGSIDSDGTIITYEWAWTSGSATGSNPQINLMEIGVYDITLTVTDERGGQDTDVVTITVNEPPNEAPLAMATANPDAGVAPLTTTLDASASTDADGTIVSYTWVWEGGGSASGVSVTETFALGSYNVTLTVTDEDGATDATTISVVAFNSQTDTDNDGVIDADDNCPAVFNPDQNLFTFYADADGDGFGDPNDTVEGCEAPPGYVANADDNCPTISSADLTDTDNDGEGDLCDDDDDGDGLPDTEDCDPLDPAVTNGDFYYADFDNDGFGDPQDSLQACSAPPNYVANNTDNCPEVTNADQTDADNDGIGDICDPTIPGVNTFVLEAECAEVGSDWLMEIDPAASNGVYLTYDGPNAGTPPVGDVPDSRIRFSIDNVAAGDYYIYARVYGATSSDDSYWARVNDAAWGLNGNNFANLGSYVWNGLVSNPVSLVEGTNVVDLSFRENGLRIDKLYISTEVGAPAGLGGDALNCDGGQLNDPPVAVAAATPTEGVAPLNIQLDGSGSTDSDGTIITYNWSWNGGSTQGVSPQIELADIGVYDISLTVIDGRGGQGTDVVTVTVNEPPNEEPIAVATATPESGVAPLSVTLNGTASSDADGSIVSYSWAWDGGGSASGATVTEVFALGSYDVTLTVTDDEGAIGTTTLSVVAFDNQTDTDNDGVIDADDNCPTVYNPDQSLFTFYADVDGDGFGDPDDTIQDCEAPQGYVANADDNCPAINSTDLTDTDNDGEGDLCDDDDDGDGLPDAEDCDPLDPAVTNGDFYYADFDGDGFGDPADSLQACSAPPNYVADNTDNCPGDANPDQTDFDGDGIGDTCDPTIPGVNTFTLEAECAEVGSDWLVETDPAASNGIYLTYDGPNAGTPPAGEDPASRIRFSLDNVAAGDYYIYVRVYGATSSDDSYWARVNGADWGLNGNNFANLGSYVWNGLISNPVSLVDGTNVVDLSFRENGLRIDRLYISTEVGAPAGMGGDALNCDGGQLNDPPVAAAAATPTEGIAPLNVQLDGTGSTDSDGTIVSYDWSWTGGSAQGDSPAINLADVGVYDITLTVTDERGGQDTDIVTVTVNEPPNEAPVAVATASPESGVAPLSVTLNGTGSTDSDGSIVSYDWTWDGGGSASGATVTEVFSLGSYVVTLTVTDEDGAQGTTTLSVVAFDNQTDTDNDGVIDADDNCPTVFNPDQSLFTFYGDADGDGFGDPNDTVQDCEAPQGYVANADDNCPAVSSMDLTDTDNDGEGDLCDDDDDGDGLPDAEDCDPLDPAVTNGDFYYADFDGDGFGDPMDSLQACTAPLNYVANNTDNCPEDTNPDQTDFDGDGIGDACDPTIPGVNTFTLEAECAEVGSDWLVETDPAASNGIYLTYNGPNAGTPPVGDVPASRIRFSLDNVAAGDYYVYVRVYGASSNDDSYWARINDGDWGLNGNNFATFGDYVWNSLLPNPVSLTEGANTIDLSFRENGLRIDKLYISTEIGAPAGAGGDAFNCDGAQLNDPPVALAAANPTEGIAPLNVQLDGTGSTDSDGMIVSYDWSWTGGTAQGATPQIDLTEVGVYNLTLTVTDDRGGQGTDIVTVTVNEPPNEAPMAVATATPVTGPAPLSVSLDGTGTTDSDGTIVSYAWTWNGGGSASGATVTEVFALGSYDITLTVTDDDGATATATVSVVAFDNQTDTDSDGVVDVDDNCPTVANPDQSLFTFYADTDGDGFGDPANTVEDCEAPPGYVANADDNCPTVNSADLTDTDNDGMGDICDDDDDGDGLPDAEDCDPLDPAITNGDFYYADFDGDGFGDPTDSLQACSAPMNYVANKTDNCLDIANPNQADSDGDGVGDACDPSTLGLNLFILEAECSEFGTDWFAAADAAASNGLYLTYTGPNAGTPPVGEVPESRIRFTIDGMAAGDYHLYVRVFAASANDDSYWSRLNAGDWLFNGNNFSSYGSYTWHKLAQTPISLAAGTNQVDLSYREDGIRFDKLYCSLDATPPTGLGENAINCGGEASVQTDEELLETAGTFVPVNPAEANRVTNGSFPTSISKSDAELRFFPNPANDHLNFRLNSDFRGVTEAVILDLRGRVVATHRYDKRFDRLEDRLEVSDLPAGTYLLRVTEGDRHLNRKFVKLP